MRLPHSRVVALVGVAAALAVAAGLARADPEATAPEPSEATTPEQPESDEPLVPGALPFPTEFAIADRVHLYWNEGLHIDGRLFQFLFGGRIQLDGGVLDPNQQLADAFDLEGTYTRGQTRRARVRFNGIFFDDYYFRFAYDFAQSSFADILIGTRKVPQAERIQLGNQKEPFSLEEMTSSNQIVFMERGLPNALVPGRNVGIRIDGTYFDRRLEFSTGVFRNTAAIRQFSEVFSDTGSGTNVAFRVSGLPIFEENGRRLLHVGVAYDHAFRSDDELSYQSNPESNLAPILADTGQIQTDGIDLLNLTTAWVDGPLALQGEYVGSFVDRPDAPRVKFYGLYVFASYFLTGEHRRFNTTWAEFQRVLPKRDFSFSGGGFGAVQIAARYSRLDLDGGDVSGGVLNDVTVGVNWFLTRNARITGNVVLSQLRSTGRMVIGQLRVQLAY